MNGRVSTGPIYITTPSLKEEWGNIIRCPVCGGDKNFFDFDIKIHGGAKEQVWMGKGDCAKIGFYCDIYAHNWYLCIGSQEGDSYLYHETNESADYSEYIISDEWKEKADEAKKRVGYRCNYAILTESFTHIIEPMKG